MTQTQRDAEIADIKKQLSALEDRLKSLEAPPTPARPPPGAQQSSGATGSSAGQMKVAVRASPSPPDRAFVASGSSASFSASSDGGIATISVAETLDRVDAHKAGMLLGIFGKYALVGDAFQGSISAPLNKSGGISAIADLNGLASSTELKLSWLHYVRPIAPPIVPAELQTAINAAIKACMDDVSEPRPVPKENCDKPGSRPDVLESYSTSKYINSFGNIDIPENFALLGGITGGVGYQQNTFLNLSSYKNRIVDHVPFEVKAFGSAIIDKYGSVTASFDYQFAYADQKSAVICQNQTGSTATTFTCLQNPVGSPARNSKQLLALEYRTYVHSFLFINTWSIAPQVTYDFSDRESGVDIPIYFITDKSNNLIGGLRLGYSSKSHFVAGLMIDAPFSLFGP